ncbi:MAG: histidine kinase [Bacteroidota bacterium]
MNRIKSINGILKARINIILPIALALILPMLSQLSNSSEPILKEVGAWGTWLTTTVSLFFLWHILLRLRNANNKKQKVLWSLGLLAYLSILFILTYIFTSQEQGIIKWHLYIRIFFPMLLIFLIQGALKNQENLSQLRLEKEQIQTENYRSQLKALRNQIDPHFLFNSLNTLRSMVRQGHDNAEKFIISLSDFYRQTLKHNENATLPLSDELAVMESYLFLMKNRNEEAIKLKIDIDPQLMKKELPSMALQVVLENCFKHNSMTSKNPLCIEIGNSNEQYLMVSNNIQEKLGHEDSSGYGLDLLRKRYDLMNIKEGLLIEKNSQTFKVELKLI